MVVGVLVKGITGFKKVPQAGTNDSHGNDRQDQHHNFNLKAHFYL
jgi:hypothetical protein